MAATEEWLTRNEAAALCGTRYDSIRRAKRAGKLPHSELRGGKWMVPMSDLVAAGMLQVVSPSDPVEPADGFAPGTLGELARAQEEIKRLEAVLECRESELNRLWEERNATREERSAVREVEILRQALQVIAAREVA